MKNKTKSVNVLTSKKSQITLFMILGIIILFAFGFLYFSISSSTKARVRAQVVQQAEDVLNQRTTRYYTHLCIKDVLKEGLVLLGKQGGYIYPGQPGSIIPQGYIQFNADNIPYLIKPSQFSPPSYPCYSLYNPPVYCAFINNITLFSQLYSTVFGANLLPYIQKFQGRYSIQEQLESYVSAQAPACMPSLSEIPEFSNYDFSTGKVTSEIEFASSGVSVKIDYPVVIAIPNIEPASATLKLQATVNVRFKQLYDAVKDIIQYDNNYLDYNILDDTYAGSYLGRQLKFSVLDNVSFTAQFGRTEDVFIMNDTKSDIEIRPFVFKFARKNRYPALDYIPEGPPKSVFEFIVYSNETLRIEPKAFDPDEDALTYSYHGWKAEYDSVWDNATRTQSPPRSTLANYWERSSLFQQTARSAEINLTPSDKGIHNFTVNVSDDSNLVDYQVIRVLVDRFLRAEGEADNFYEDIDNTKASIEDPYLLTVTSETVLVDPTTRYVYTWLDRFTNTVLHKGNFSCLLLPVLRSCSAFNASINNMVGPFSTISTAPDRIGLTVDAFGINNQTASTTFNVTVYECLPHIYSYSPPYPFHNTKDPFQADHFCCSMEGTIRTGEECMRLEEYTCYIPGQPAGIAGKAVQEATGTPPTLWPATIIPDITAPRSDSIFKRTFVQLCGRRGNACSGEITDKWVLHKRCNINESFGTQEHCQGPARTKECQINQVNPECHNYRLGESFEKTFLKSPAATGICNPERKCSPAIADRSPENNYGGEGPLDCQAQCSGQGPCTAAANCICSKDKCSNDVSSKCNNRPPGYSANGGGVADLWNAVFGTPKDDVGCDFNCQWVDCGNYTFDPISKQCRIRADSQVDCDDGFTYDQATSSCS
ncbi:hypothetical protein KY331_01945 [Candidatus Woesearchaeota archaeon]|nr:hypothetical protein [Candidatus Woesearchaeota archaeon]